MAGREVKERGKGGADAETADADNAAAAGSLEAFEGPVFVCGKQTHPPFRSHTMETILFRQRKCQITEREREHVSPRAIRKPSSCTVSGLPSWNDAAILKPPQCWHTALQ